MKPSIGRIVHIMLPDRRDPLAAIVVTVTSDTLIGVRAFETDQMPPAHYVDVPHESIAEEKSGFWRWPPRL